MALIKCPECGKEISDKAVTCPNCGCPVEQVEEPQVTEAVPDDKATEQPKKNNVGLITFIVCVLVVGIMAAFVMRTPKNDYGVGKVTASEKAVNCARKAVTIGEQYVDGSLDGSGARRKLDELRDELSYTHEDNARLTDDKVMKDWYIDTDIFTLAISISRDSSGLHDNTAFDEVKDAIEKLRNYTK